MSSRKRSYADAMAPPKEEKPASQSPFMPMFEQFRAELDEHHDRRERIVKASRDITAASKKIIFSLQRYFGFAHAVHYSHSLGTGYHVDAIRNLYSAVAPELQDLNAYRYTRNITWGNQEFMEAISFQHYLETQSLISFHEAQAQLTELCKRPPQSEEKTDVNMDADEVEDHKSVALSPSDYILGIFDMTGELMRFAVTTMATTGELPKGRSGRTALQDLRDLRSMLESLDFESGSPLAWEVGKKMAVMQASVEKVENAMYGLTVRGAERPKGWLPDMNESRVEEIEGY